MVSSQEQPGKRAAKQPTKRKAPEKEKKPRPRPKIDEKDKAKALAQGQKAKAEDGTASSRAQEPSKRGAPQPRQHNERTAKPAERTSQDQRSRPPRTKEKRSAGRTIALVALIVVILVGGLFAWQRWFRFDDASDIQGVWKVNAANETMVIDASQMNLVNGVSYAYTLDTWGKTISFSFSNLSGSGSYYFSGDRQRLVIGEGGSTANILVQLGLQEDANVVNDTMDDSTTVLTKISNDTAATPQTLENNEAYSSELGAAIVGGEVTVSTDSAATESTGSAHAAG